MRPVQYFLGKAAEEAAELIQILIKAQAFGVEEFYAKDLGKRNNAERVREEFNDLLATIERLNREMDVESPGIVAIEEVPSLMDAKHEKLEKYFHYSIEKGETVLPESHKVPIISDEEIIKVWQNANFGESPKRRVIHNALVEIAGGYRTGHTAECIVRELGLVTGEHVTHKGLQVMFEYAGRDGRY